MQTFNILKKNRKYFAATTKGYKCKIVVDDNSNELEPGEVELEVEDISVRSKYGTDLIFKLKASMEQQKGAGICTLQHYTVNRNLVNECRNLGGKWDGDSMAWIFSGLVEDKVEELDEKYNSPLVGIEICFKEDETAHTDGIYLCGILLAKASGRDSGARLGDGISLISGNVSSGGSVKNWITRITEGTVLRLQVPEALLNEINLNCDVKRI